MPGLPVPVVHGHKAHPGFVYLRLGIFGGFAPRPFSRGKALARLPSNQLAAVSLESPGAI